jgi:hypothetical protein
MKREGGGSRGLEISSEVAKECVVDWTDTNSVLQYLYSEYEKVEQYPQIIRSAFRELADELSSFPGELKWDSRFSHNFIVKDSYKRLSQVIVRVRQALLREELADSPVGKGLFIIHENIRVD